MENERLKATIKIEKRYQFIRTLINVAVFFMIFIVIYNQTKILNANRTTILEIQRVIDTTNAHIDCVATAEVNDKPINC